MGYHTSTRTTYSSSTTRSSTTSLESLQKPKKKSSTRSTISISVPSKLGELRVATINDDNKTTFSGDGDREDFGEKKFCDIFQGRWMGVTIIPGIRNSKLCLTFFLITINATDFLERLRGKKMVFVGDSLNRNMYESLIRILRNDIKDKNRISKLSGRKEFKVTRDYALRFKDYNCSIVFVWSPFLVGDSATEYRPRMHGSPVAENLRLDLVDKVTSSAYRDADIIVFNSWRWWTNEKTNKKTIFWKVVDYTQNWDYIKHTGKVLLLGANGLTRTLIPTKPELCSEDIQLLTSCKYRNLDIRGSEAYTLLTVTLNHLYAVKGDGTRGKCNLEKEPITSNATYKESDVKKLKILQHVLQQMKTPVLYLDINKLTFYRSDGHPSMYARKFKTIQERIAAH
ncbi:protein trichome birefringence-like 2 [Papaver somniferum]|uniref:protein trichome birefringence-like 2 n=1 Tax=Papaver somniferum TaxID=3469 RepID=UPI000E7017D2|nr:protein trichome birefringence-like 2 [Papaver somniferum]